MRRRGTWWVLASSGLLALGAVQGLTGHPHRAIVAVTLAVDLLVVGVLVLEPRTRWLTPGVAPVLLGALIGALGHPDRAAPLGAIAVVFLVLLAVGVDVGRGIARVVTVASAVLTAVAGGAVFVSFVLPAWAWSRLRRRDPLRTGPDRGPAWFDRTASTSPSSLASITPGIGDSRGLVGRLSWALGSVVLLAATNYGIGWAWDQATASDPAGAAPSRLDAPAGAPKDPRADLPAMAKYPWRDRYFADLRRTPGVYWPFTEFRPMAFSSPYVNIGADWTRKSYTPAGDPDTMPKVWMFGGSTTFGEGQRDEYTIASYVARLAETDGIPISIANYGQRGWTHFQEMILYEQLLARGPAPDFSIFYDGANEITSQSLVEEAIPTHTLAYTYAAKLGLATVATELASPVPSSDPIRELWHSYSQHSAIHKVAGWLRGEPVGAAPAEDPPPGFTPTQDPNPERGIFEYQTTPQDGTDAGKVYERGKRLTLTLGKEYGVDTTLFWQPMGFKGEPAKRAIAQLTPPTVDISDVLLDHADTFIDGGHTNEEGARIVAEAIWREIRPAISRWYEDR